MGSFIAKKIVYIFFGNHNLNKMSSRKRRHEDSENEEYEDGKITSGDEEEEGEIDVKSRKKKSKKSKKHKKDKKDLENVLKMKMELKVAQPQTKKGVPLQKLKLEKCWKLVMMKTSIMITELMLMMEDPDLRQP